MIYRVIRHTKALPASTLRITMHHENIILTERRLAPPACQWSTDCPEPTPASRPRCPKMLFLLITDATLCIYLRLPLDPIFLVALSTEAHSRNAHLARTLHSSPLSNHQTSVGFLRPFASRFIVSTTGDCLVNVPGHHRTSSPDFILLDITDPAKHYPRIDCTWHKI